MAERRIRFGVANADRTLRSASWRCWTNGGGDNSVYLTCREIGASFHTSLHQTGEWHTGFDLEKMNGLFEDDSRPSSRFMGQWERPPPLVAGWTIAARIYVPWNALTAKPYAGKGEVEWMPPLPAGMMYEFVLLLGDLGTVMDEWPGKGDEATLVGGFELADGSRAVVGCLKQPLMHAKMAGDSPYQIAPSFFRGKSEADLRVGTVAALLIGQEPNGPAIFYDQPVTIT